MDRARGLGHLGPGPLDPQIDHSLRLGSVVEPPQSGPAVDLGSGGGLPGLVLAGAWTVASWVLVDGSAKRTDFLRWAVTELGWEGRVEVRTERAEVTGRGPLRAQVPLVVARGFGPPAVTAECAAPLLLEGGHLVVTDPPGGGTGRWPAEGLAPLGLVPERAFVHPVALQVLRQESVCPDRFPRRTGIPVKRPLF